MVADDHSPFAVNVNLGADRRDTPMEMLITGLFVSQTAHKPPANSRYPVRTSVGALLQFGHFARDRNQILKMSAAAKFLAAMPEIAGYPGLVADADLLEPY